MKGALPSYKDAPRVALTNGAISGSSESESYVDSDTSKYKQVTRRKNEAKENKAKSVNSAGSAFQGLYSTQNRTPIKFTPKKETVEYRLNESLNGNAN
ncbi:hypothetical protein CS537_19510 [Yersinia mollaretii]|nr:hypothetical protein CS537_19510 [Yersinia mollaretii]